MVSWTHARSHLARAVQTGEPAEVITELRREYVAARLAHLIRSAVPQLPVDQRAELAATLQGGGDGNAS